MLMIEAFGVWEAAHRRAGETEQTKAGSIGRAPAGLKKENRAGQPGCRSREVKKDCASQVLFFEARPGPRDCQRLASRALEERDAQRVEAGFQRHLPGLGLRAV